jgi:single-strand DNA-binding protein
MQVLKNSVQLIGNLGKDVEIRSFDSGSKKATLALATTEYYKNNKGELVKNTQWHNLVAWGKNAEMMAKVLTKGSMVAVAGSLSNRSYTDSSGQTRYITEVLVSEFMKLDKSGNKESEEAMAAVNAQEENLPF